MPYATRPPSARADIQRGGAVTPPRRATGVFGVNVDPVWHPAGAPLRRAQDAERPGLDLVTIQDHLYQPEFYDAWTLLTFMAAQTQNITVVPTVLPS